ncbi:VOC family protein [Motilibacter aurantiacus]|uniref:VOC family protein n=1 Tax=Motilibacter aurantiacus TaxID=2714955 RepID=UPI001407CF42|nr:VOC family protein [Motilibacter aurantiacus]NHC46413.1 glyoxalase [Motilibacter aurantiacus]
MTSPTDCWVSLTCHDAPRIIAFLAEAYGFVELARHGEGDRVDHAELASPGGRGGVMLGTARAGGTRGPAAPGTTTAYVVVPDTDALFARATAAGAEVVSEPVDTDYGSRDCALRDPEGNTWFFGTYLGTSLGDAG